MPAPSEIVFRFPEKFVFGIPGERFSILRKIFSFPEIFVFDFPGKFCFQFSGNISVLQNEFSVFRENEHSDFFFGKIRPSLDWTEVCIILLITKFYWHRNKIPCSSISLILHGNIMSAINLSLSKV